MTTKIEAPGLSHNHYRPLDKLATALLSIDTDDAHRHEVANIVREHGFAPYVGSSYVAVHAANADGEMTGERLAIITHMSRDFGCMMSQ